MVIVIVMIIIVIKSSFVIVVIVQLGSDRIGVPYVPEGTHRRSTRVQVFAK